MSFRQEIADSMEPICDAPDCNVPKCSVPECACDPPVCDECPLENCSADLNLRCVVLKTMNNYEESFEATSTCRAAVE